MTGFGQGTYGSGSFGSGSPTQEETVALTITSFSPATGPTTGSTRVAIVGTGLDTVDEVSFGNVPGTIVNDPSNSPTSLIVEAPAIADAGAVKINLVDNDTDTEVSSATTYSYSAVTTPPLTSTPAWRWVLEVDGAAAQDGSDWLKVRGMTDFQPAVNTTTQDDSDYDTGLWGSDAKTQLKWSCSVKLSRKRSAGYIEDPGQGVIRAAHDKAGVDGTVHVRWYDRNGGDEAYEGFAMVEWSEDGGNTQALSTVSVTLSGQGARTQITNPAGA